MNFRWALSVVGVSLAACMSTSAWAGTNTLTVYTQPNISSKVIETVTPTTPLVTIFQKDGWSKVGNTQNGEIGWVQSSKLADQTHQTIKTLTTKDGIRTVTNGVVHTPQGEMQYQMTQFQGKPTKLSAKQEKAEMVHWQAQQESMRKSFDQMQTNMMKQMQQQQAMMNAFWSAPEVKIEKTDTTKKTHES